MVRAEDCHAGMPGSNLPRHNGTIFSRARPTLNLPCISPQTSVTCNGEYRRPVIKAQPSFHGVLTNGREF